MAGSFTKACELWEMIAGPDDWDEFAVAFDDVLAGLDSRDLEAISLFIDSRRVKVERPGAGEPPPLAARDACPATGSF